MINVSYVYRSLLFPFSFFIILLIVFLFFYGVINYYKQEVEQNYHLQVAEVDALYNEFNEINNKTDLINTYLDRFQFVKNSGYLNKQSRVDWIDGLIELTSVYGVRKAAFNFSSRDKLDSVQQPRLASFSEVLQRESLEMEGEFQHEVDVFNLINDVVKKVNPLAVVESCQLISLNQKNHYGLTASDYTFQPDKGNIAIKCRLELLTLSPPKVVSSSEVQP